MAITDYLILTPLDEEWNNAANILFHPPYSESKVGSITYYLGCKELVRGLYAKSKYLIVGAPMAHKTPGQSYASTFSTLSLGEWKPARVVLIGIAGSIEPNRLHLGDVVISDSIWGYEVGDVVGKQQSFRKTFNQIDSLDLDSVRAFKRAE